MKKPKETIRLVNIVSQKKHQKMVLFGNGKNIRETRSTCFPTYLVLLKEAIFLIIIPMMVPCLDTCLIHRFTMTKSL